MIKDGKTLFMLLMVVVGVIAGLCGYMRATRKSIKELNRHLKKFAKKTK